MHVLRYEKSIACLVFVLVTEYQQTMCIQEITIIYWIIFVYINKKIRI